LWDLDSKIAQVAGRLDARTSVRSYSRTERVSGVCGIVKLLGA
jgi:hypothetical protein